MYNRTSQDPSRLMAKINRRSRKLLRSREVLPQDLIIGKMAEGEHSLLMSNLSGGTFDMSVLVPCCPLPLVSLPVF
jgi:hypothetical protein